jgi:small subunit ribosomal protein S21
LYYSDVTAREVILLPVVRVRENEPLEKVLRNFKRQCDKEGIISDVKKREFYDKPSVKKKKKTIAARKKAAKMTRGKYSAAS